MSFLDNVSNSFEKAGDKIGSQIDKASQFAEDRSSDIWNSMKDGSRSIKDTASQLPEFLDFGAESLFNSKLDLKGSLKAGPVEVSANFSAGNQFADGTSRSVTDGTSNTVLIGEKDNGRGREDGGVRFIDEQNNGRHDDCAYDGRDNNGREALSPVEMVQQLESIAQQLAQLTQLLSLQGNLSGGFPGGGFPRAGFSGEFSGGFPGGQGELSGKISGSLNPAEIIGQVADIAQKLAPLAKAIAPALLLL